jgi:hypothetical protein
MSRPNISSGSAVVLCRKKSDGKPNPTDFKLEENHSAEYWIYREEALEYAKNKIENRESIMFQLAIVEFFDENSEKIRDTKNSAAYKELSEMTVWIMFENGTIRGEEEILNFLRRKAKRS